MPIIALPAILILIGVALLLYHWATKAQNDLYDSIHTVTMSQDEIIEMIVILADWTDMNDLRHTNGVNANGTKLDDPEYAKALARTEASVKAFQEKF